MWMFWSSAKIIIVGVFILLKPIMMNYKRENSFHKVNLNEHSSAVSPLVSLDAPLLNQNLMFVYSFTGWVNGHGMLNRDQAKIKEIAAAFLAQTEANIALTPAQRSALDNFFQRWSDFLHHHHHVEEDIIFAYLTNEKNVELQPKLSLDHKHFIEELEKCKKWVQGVAAGKQTTEEDASTLKELLVSISRCL